MVNGNELYHSNWEKRIYFEYQLYILTFYIYSIMAGAANNFFLKFINVHYIKNLEYIFVCISLLRLIELCKTKSFHECGLVNSLKENFRKCISLFYKKKFLFLMHQSLIYMPCIYANITRGSFYSIHFMYKEPFNNYQK